LKTGRSKKIGHVAEYTPAGAVSADEADGNSEAAPQPLELDNDGFFALTSDTCYRTDAEGRIVFASPSAKNLFGYTDQDLLGRPLSDFYADPVGRAEFLRQIKDNGGRLSGYEVWVSTSSHFWFDENGEFAGVEGIARDVTRRREADEALKESEARLVEVQCIAKLGYWDRDLITN
jgi:PAS domain S-box-containing protein